MVSAGRELRREQSRSALLRSERGWRAAAAPASDFRKRHLKALAGLFGQVLKLCEQAGLVKLGHVTLDGTKIKANASKHKAMSYERGLME